MKRIVLFILLSLSLSLVFGTQVSGNQTGIWSPENNPYEVVGVISVPANGNLTIMPGVIVQITGSFQITVTGTMICEGTEADSIRFLNMQANPNALWPGLRFENTTQSSSVSYTYIEKGTYGIRCMNSPLTVSHCRINLCEKGMELYAIGAPTPNNVLVEYNLIENCIQNGILVTQNSGATINYNEIRGNGTGAQFRAAIQLANQSASGSCNPMINNNHIHHNLKQGISAWDVSSSGAINPMILSNVIEYNYTGVYLLQASGYVADNQINYNFIPGDMNSGAGVMVSGATAEPYFERNHIEGNYTGFYVTNNGKPVLGDLSIYHAWAQGENVIVNNIDANGILHSVYCDTYPNASFVIKAENNNWGVATADEIAIGINDHNDNPALPTVDFEPFLTPVMPTSIVGSYVYNGQYPFNNAILEIISVANGSVLFVRPLDSDSISVAVPVEESFYAQVVLNRQDSVGLLYGVSGGYLNPTVFSPGDFAPVEIGSITVSDAPPPLYEKVGDFIEENDLVLFPVMNGMGVYGWRNLDWVTVEGDFLILRRNLRRTPGGEVVTNIPGGAVFRKYQNVISGDSWTETRVVDENGTIVPFTVTMNGCSTYLGIYGYDLYTCKTPDGNVRYKLMDSPEGKYLYQYQNGWLQSRERLIASGGQTPFGTAVLTLFLPEAPVYQPSYLAYNSDLFEIQPPTWQVHLMWQGPMLAANNWTHYRIFRNDAMIAEIPFWEMEYIDNWNPSLGGTWYNVCAWDGENLSESTNFVVVMISDNEDEYVSPVVMSFYPNPVPRGNELKVKLQNLGEREAELNIFNLKGQKVYSTKGNSDTLLWNRKDTKGRSCAAGVYFMKLKIAGKEVYSRKLVLQ